MSEIDAPRSLAALTLLVVALLGSRASAQDRPNVILVVADDLGRAELGAYGQRALSTPRLDALAAGGARFAAAYTTAPVCAPSRCSILTGLHAGHCAVLENDEPNQPLPSRDPTVAELLASVGYHGAMVGKWALGGELDDGTPWNTQSAPWRVGFTDVLAIVDQEIAQDHYPEWLWRSSVAATAERTTLPGNADGARGSYAADLFSARALELARTSPEPFFLYFAATLPHRELVVPPGAPPVPEGLSEPDAAYAAMVARLDAHVGALLDALANRGIARRTVLVFTSDNGPNAIDGHALETFVSQGGLRGQKRDLYEGGVRVPLLVAGPGIEPRVIEEPVMLTDLLPTFTALGGAPTPPWLDGLSLVPLLSGAAVPLHQHLYFACHERRGGAEEPTREAVREGDWKWVRRGESDELYDLATDPGERTDLAASEPERVAHLRALAAEATAPRPGLAPPVLAVRVNGAEVGPSPRPGAPTPLLVLDPDDVEDDARTWPQRLERPALLATVVGAEVVRGHADHVRFDRARGDHVVVPADPALAVFGGSFTLRARVRLASLASGPDRDARQWLFFAKPTGLPDVHAAFGVLVQGGDFGCSPEAPHDCTGREIAVLFGDRRFAPAPPFVVAGTLRIEDLEVHDLTVRIDRSIGQIELALDERRETIPFLVNEGITTEAPIIVGGHHDAHGRFGQGFDGDLHGLALLEGLASDEELAAVARRMGPRHARVRAGNVPRGHELLAELELESLALPGAHWLEAEVELDEGVRAELGGTPRALLFGGDRQRITVRVDTSRIGRVAADLTVRARRGRSGAMVEGVPVRVHVRANVVEPPPPVVPRGPGIARGLGLGLGLVTLVVAFFAWRRRSSVGRAAG